MNNLHSGLLYSLTGVTALASMSSCASQKKTEEQKPFNIVYIMTDDHTAQMMSCYDKRYMETPNLDRIANDGVRFTNSFVANSLSGPSRACMITGKHSCANKLITTCIKTRTEVIQSPCHIKPDDYPQYQQSQTSENNEPPLSTPARHDRNKYHQRHHNYSHYLLPRNRNYGRNSRQNKGYIRIDIIGISACATGKEAAEHDIN